MNLDINQAVDLLTNKLTLWVKEFIRLLPNIVLAAVILGGASLLGGSGTIFKTVIGVLILGFIQNGLLLVGLQFYVQFVVTWIIIILAVWLDIAAKRGKLWSNIA